MKKFNESRVKETNGIAEVIELDKQGKLFDVLPDISKGRTDLEIMDKWMDWFKAKKVPFAVTDEGNRFVLWKERCV